MSFKAQLEEHTHERSAILFGSTQNIKQKFDAIMNNEVPSTVVEGVAEHKLFEIAEAAAMNGSQNHVHQMSALTVIMMSHTIEEAQAIAAGLITHKPKGLILCPGCLAKTIFFCEEQLNALKALQVATKEYCK